MRLRRIEATRFGRLQDATLGPLGDGLTVVLGPNEAGKSSFTALARHLLYGFPTEKSSSERPYLSDAGTREGRLVFESAEGEWVIERTAGPKGGPWGVRALRGPERPGLVDEITSGVSEQAFKVVFGFGLAEMAEIERLRGTDDDIIARLYAAGAGLSVSPQEVRAAIEGDADALFKKGRASKPAINALVAEARELRSQISRLEHDAESLVGDRARLADLAAELEQARVERDETAALHRTLLEEARALSDLEEAVGAADEELLGLRREARDAAAALEAIAVDEAAIGFSADIIALSEELSAFRQRLEAVAELEGRVGSLTAESAGSLVEAGLDAESAAAVDVSPETRAGVERWRDRLLTAEQRARTALEEREATAEEAQVVSGTVGGTEPVPASASGGPNVLAWLTVAAGVVIAGIGVYLGQWIAVAAGVLLTAFAAMQAAGGRAAMVPLTADSARLAGRADDLARRAEQAALAAERIERELGEARREWTGWLEARGLSGVTEPAAAVRVLDLVTDARRRESERAQAAERLARELEAVVGFTGRVAKVAAGLGMPAPTDAREADAAVVRLRERLGEARIAAEAADRAKARAHTAGAAVTDAESRRASAATRAQEIIERLDVPGGLAELSATVERAAVASEEAQERWGMLKSKHASLETLVGEREREDTMGSIRFELVSVNERISEHAERYAVLSLASRLLQRAQERYERERQPEVVREAERIFATITGGGYTRLSVPLGASAIEVFDASASAKDTGRLSTGTAEQLYLALRLALIGQLEETGAALPVLMDDVLANFDPERKAGAAAAVAELARTRQVVVFTCHPETAEVLGSAEPGLSTLSLDRC
ncbi:MAG: AAA family ATPase [Coriobacteriia bacterium]|nr:AAA family ATPase [Coriobacteriia bacterium]